MTYFIFGLLDRKDHVPLTTSDNQSENKYRVNKASA